MKKERFIPLKNYFIMGAIIIGSILLTLYIFKWYQVISENKYQESYLITHNVLSKEITSIKEFKNVLTESPENYFLLISYTGDKDVYNMEKSLEHVIQEYHLNEEIYYLNITDIKNDSNYLDLINDTLGFDEKISKVPTIVYIKDGTVTKDNIITRSDNKIISDADFQKLLDINNIEP